MSNYEKLTPMFPAKDKNGDLYYAGTFGSEIFYLFPSKIADDSNNAAPYTLYKRSVRVNNGPFPNKRRWKR